MEEELNQILKSNLTFPDIKDIDPSYYKNNKWKIEAAQKVRDEKIDVKVKGLVNIIVSKINFGVSYSEKTEKYLSEVIYPLIIKIYTNKTEKIMPEIKLGPTLYQEEPEE